MTRKFLCGMLVTGALGAMASAVAAESAPVLTVGGSADKPTDAVVLPVEKAVKKALAIPEAPAVTAPAAPKALEVADKFADKKVEVKAADEVKAAITIADKAEVKAADAAKPAGVDTPAITVDKEHGVVVEVKEGEKVRTLPAIEVNNTAELANYQLPNTASQDFYAYAHGEKDGMLPGSDPAAGMLSLSLIDAENMALSYSWALRSQMENRRAARGKKLGAVGAALPSFGFQTNFGGEQNYTDITGYAPASRGNFSMTPSISQPLFHGGKIISGIRSANANTRKVEEDIRYSRLMTRYEIRKLYYLCMLNMKKTDVYRKQTKISKEYWQKTQKRHEAGDVAEVEVLRYQVQYRLKEANYINARNDFNTAMTQLLRYMGKPLNTYVVLTDSYDFTEFEPGNEQELVDYALAHRPDLKSARLQQKIAKEGVRQAKADVLPTVDIVAQYTYGNSYQTQVERYGDKWNWAAGLQLNWNALAGMGATLRGKILEANAALCQAEFSIEDKIDEIKQQVRNSILTIMSSIEWVKSQKENVAQANRVLEEQNIRWSEGAGNYLDILDAQTSVGDAELSYWNGINTFKTSIVELEFALGKFYQSTQSEVQGMQVKNTRKVAARAENDDPFAALATPGTASVARAAESEIVPATVIAEGNDAPVKSAAQPMELPELKDEGLEIQQLVVPVAAEDLPELHG